MRAKSRRIKSLDKLRCVKIRWNGTWKKSSKKNFSWGLQSKQDNDNNCSKSERPKGRRRKLKNCVYCRKRLRNSRRLRQQFWKKRCSLWRPGKKKKKEGSRKKNSERNKSRRINSSRNWGTESLGKKGSRRWMQTSKHHQNCHNSLHNLHSLHNKRRKFLIKVHQAAAQSLVQPQPQRLFHNLLSLKHKALLHSLK